MIFSSLGPKDKIAVEDSVGTVSTGSAMNEVTIKGEVKFVDEIREYGANGFKKHQVVVDHLKVHYHCLQETYTQ